MRPDDYIFPYYRDRALMLARGFSNYDLAPRLFRQARQQQWRPSDARPLQRPSHNVFPGLHPHRRQPDPRLRRGLGDEARW